jgi:8-oxo-dGTP diphosphatase
MTRRLEINCPGCGKRVLTYRNPFPTVDLIIRCQDSVGQEGIVLVQRRNPPLGWALPGGFVDYGESLEEAAAREALEETGLMVSDLKQFHAYSDPSRDPRQHNISVVFLARAQGIPRPGDDAAGCKVFPLACLPERLAFDHSRILADYLAYLSTGRCP